VYPKEIENVLTQYPNVQDAGVIGIEDAIRGEIPKAYIVPKLGATIDEKDVLAFCRKHLAQFKIPRSIEIIDEIPKNVTGKILKRVLRRIAAGLPADEDEDEFDDDDFGSEEEVLGVDETELEEVEEVMEEEPSAPVPPAGGMSLEEQMRQMESGAMPTPPPAGGMSLEDQMQQMEAGAMPTPPPAGGMSLEEQMRQMETGGVGMPSAPPQPQAPSYEGEPVGFDEALRNLVMEIAGGIAGSIAGIDGIGIASFSTDPDFPTTIADAELASVIGTMRKTAQSLSAGTPKEAFFVVDRYGFVVKMIRDQYLVTLVVEASELNWGLIRLHLNKIVPQIERELF
jgi:predicted regulator of Ras-like GTPase activity (Roadblock/LC7/MglB family)